MGQKIYTVANQGTVTTAGADADIWTITPATNKPVRLRGFVLSQFSEVGDAAEENLRFSILHMTATVTAGNGSSTTPKNVDQAGAAAGFTALFNGATVATTSGTSTTMAELAWNERMSPYEFWFPDPDFAFMARQGEVLLIRQQTTAADDYSIASTVWIEEC